MFDLGKFRVDGTRESAPVKKKPKLDEAVKEVVRNKKPLKLLEHDLNVDLSRKDARRAETLDIRAASSEVMTSSASATTVPRGTIGKSTVVRSQSFDRQQPKRAWSSGKKLTPIAPMKLTDPRAEKLSVETLMRRFGIQRQERPR